MDDVVDDATSVPREDASRRFVVGGLLGLGLGTPLLVACGSDDSDSGSGDGSGGSAQDEGSGGSGGSSGGIAKTSEVPVGGAKLFTEEKVVVSQPTAGEFKAFSTVCTHRQCAINKLDGDEIECQCHGSRFRVDDGSVAEGPASDPLEEFEVTVQGEDIVVS